MQTKSKNTESDVTWPTGGWKSSEPEEQGIDSTMLVKMLNDIESNDISIYGMIIIKHGQLVMEAYRYPYHADVLHEMNSCTKSFISALVGICLKQGKIKDLSERIINHFSDYKKVNWEGEKRNITIHNLLTMSSGLEWPGGMPEIPTLGELEQSPDSVGYVLNKPMSNSPGKIFIYNSGGSHLLSAILQRATGEQTENYAKKYLFTLNSYFLEPFL